MTARCEALVARAAGLRTRLLDPAARQSCGRSGTLGGLARELAARGYAVDTTEPDAPALETAIRRGAAARLAVLARWDPAGRAGIILLAPEELRALRRLTRGAADGRPAETRLAGLLATPGLPDPALQALSRQASVPDLAVLLARWRSPWLEAFAGAQGTEPDLLAVESGLVRVLARRTMEAARRSCHRLRDFARETVDLHNLTGAVLLAGRGDDVDPAALFLDGGRIRRDAYTRAAAAPGAAAAVAVLAPAFAQGALAAVLHRHAGDPGLLERAVAEWRLAAWRARARTEPLGAAPVIAYVLALRDEVSALQRLVWSIALGVPGPGVTAAREAA